MTRARLRTRASILFVAIVSSLSAATACRSGLVIPSADPHPQLHLSPRDAVAGLRIEFTVPEEVRLVGASGVPAVRLLDFHTTLRNAFENAFKPLFAELAENRGDFVIEISHADPSFLAQEVGVQGNAVQVRAVVSYRARLIAHRKVVGETKGQAESVATSAQLGVDGSELLAQAVAAMYEQLVADLFAQYAAAYRRSLAP